MNSDPLSSHFSSNHSYVDRFQPILNHKILIAHFIQFDGQDIKHIKYYKIRSDPTLENVP